MVANVGSFMYSEAAILPPLLFVKSKTAWAWAGVHAPDASLVPWLVATEVTMGEPSALEKSMTPFHSARVSTPRKPAGGCCRAGRSSSWKYVLFAQLPLTRTYEGLSASASRRRRGLARSMGGRY